MRPLFRIEPCKPCVLDYDFTLEHVDFRLEASVFDPQLELIASCWPITRVKNNDASECDDMQNGLQRQRRPPFGQWNFRRVTGFEMWLKFDHGLPREMECPFYQKPHVFDAEMSKFKSSPLKNPVP